MARITKTTARPARKPKAEVEEGFRLIQEEKAAAREAVRIEREELARLHRIDSAATALDQMVQDYARE